MHLYFVQVLHVCFVCAQNVPLHGEDRMKYKKGIVREMPTRFVNVKSKLARLAKMDKSYFGRDMTPEATRALFVM